MRIFVYPSDLVKYCIWDHFVYYIINSEKEAEKLLKEDKEIEISEKDALVMGLFKIIKTDNLIHKFNTYILEILSNKSINNNDLILIRKKNIDISVEIFIEKFPKYWKPDPVYKKSLKEMNDYIHKFKSNVKKIDIISITDVFGIHECLPSNSIKKLLLFNY